jgi:predicted SprT family Zn-dependent metalloprotease
MPAEYRCGCGAVLRYKQDLRREQGDVHSKYRCKDCGLPVPGHAAERIRHQSPS